MQSGSDDSMMGHPPLNYKTYSNNSAQHRQALYGSSDNSGDQGDLNANGKKFSPIIIPQQQRTNSGNSSIENFLNRGGTYRNDSGSSSNKLQIEMFR